jgi:hypothetical protein
VHRRDEDGGWRPDAQPCAAQRLDMPFHLLRN